MQCPSIQEFKIIITTSKILFSFIQISGKTNFDGFPLSSTMTFLHRSTDMQTDGQIGIAGS